MRDYAYSNLAFFTGASITEMQVQMSKVSGVELLDCFGATNRLITTVSKIADKTDQDLKDLDHYYTKRNCLYIELSKRLLDYEASRLDPHHEERQIDRDKRYREKWQGIYDRDEQDLH